MRHALQRTRRLKRDEEILRRATAGSKIIGYQAIPGSFLEWTFNPCGRSQRLLHSLS